jgi:hypothetical protein
MDLFGTHEEWKVDVIFYSAYESTALTERMLTFSWALKPYLTWRMDGEWASLEN